MSFSVTDLLWDQISGDHEADLRHDLLVRGKVASSAYWPFLSSATDESDFANRLELASNKIATVVDPSVYDDVISSLSDDFKTLHEASVKEAETKEATNYQPDPTAGWRYHHEYDQLRQPVNNGDLQDSDGFPVDLAQGEDRSNPRIEFQTTPGTWTDHDAMPERPMPFSQERGYQPVASVQFDADGFMVEADRQDHAPWARSYWDMGARHANDGKQPNMQGFRHNDSYRTAYIDGYNTGHEGQHRAPVQKDAALVFDADGFVVTAFEGRGVDPVQDPVPGAPLRVNPHYFNTGDAAMGSNEGFPQDPSLEPLEDRANTYGEVAPLQSGGSDQGTSDGKGYSRSHPGESPNFSSVAGRHSAPDTPVGLPHRDYPSQGEVYQVLQANRRIPTGMIERDHGLSHGLLGLPPAHPHSKEYMDSYAQGSRAWQPKSAARDWDRLDGPEPADEEAHERWRRSLSPEEHERRRQKWYDEHPDYDRDAWDKQASNTDGKIVDHCPGCDQPRRVHATPHGDEVRHLHNNHVRCHGSRAQKTSEYKYVKQQGDKWVITQKGTGKVLSHHDSQEEAEASFRAMMQSKHSSRPQFFDPFLGAHTWGHNHEGETQSYSYKDAIEYTKGYGTMLSPEVFSSLAAVGNGQLSNGTVHTAGDYLGRPDANNPTGKGPDEYKARTWNAFETTRPMQDPRDRNVNTPVLPEPMRTDNGRPGLDPHHDQRREDDDEDDDE